MRGIKRIVSCVVLLVMILVFVVAGLFSPLEYRVQDAAFQQARLLHPDIMIIGIDEPSLEVLGQWPWPREIMAAAIDILMSDPDFHPAVIALDIMYTEPSILMPEGDLVLADALRRAGNVVMVSNLQVGIADATLVPQIVAHQRPFEGIRPYTAYGPANAIFNSDGVIRHAMMWERFDGEVIPSFAVRVAEMYRERTGRAHEHSLPAVAEVYIPFAGYPGISGQPGDFFWFSFIDIFEPWFDPGMLHDMIVFIGTYAVGMRDSYPVSITREAPMHGVEILANVVQAVLEDNFKQMAPGWIVSLMILLALIIAMVLGEFVDLRVSVLLFAPISVGYYFLSMHLYSYPGIVMPMLTPPLALWSVFVYQLVYGYVLTAIEKTKLRQTFTKYVDPAVAEIMIKQGTADDHGVGKRTHLSCLFVDVRNFTKMSETLADTPERVVEILNEYLEHTSSAVFDNGGSVDKFVGDATMALFNGFVPLDDYVYKSVKAAWDIVQGADVVNEKIKSAYGIDIGFGVGVHCGYAIVGNLGPEFRKDYTAIGDTINTAARIESNSEARQVLLSSDVCKALEGRIVVESIGEVALKGKAMPIEVFELIGMS